MRNINDSLGNYFTWCLSIVLNFLIYNHISYKFFLRLIKDFTKKKCFGKCKVALWLRIQNLTCRQIGITHENFPSYEKTLQAALAFPSAFLLRSLILIMTNLLNKRLIKVFFFPRIAVLRLILGHLPVFHSRECTNIILCLCFFSGNLASTTMLLYAAVGYF